MENITLNEQQEIAKAAVVKWYTEEKNEKLCFVLSGYAGTGKTFLINYIIKNILKLDDNEVAFIAPTGKAASVLIQRGASNAKTIHSLIYNRVEIEYTFETNGKTIKAKRFDFVKKPSIGPFKLIILDEVSMVTQDILEDLISFGIPILASGDIGQLPAIGRANTLLQHPDINLTEIVRQENDNSIVKLATMARNNIPIPTGNYGNVIVMNKNLITEETMKNILLKADQILCGTNRTCRKINKQVKEYLGMKTDKINENEKIICLLNNWDTLLDDSGDYALVNGTIGYVKKIRDHDEEHGIGKINFQADFLDDVCKGLIFDEELFKTGKQKYEFHQQIYIMDDGSYQPKVPFVGRQSKETLEQYQERLKKYAMIKRDALYSEQLNFFQPAYACSVHKYQGSEADNIVLIDESNIFEDSAKWLYTGITRAKKNLIIIK